MPRKISTTASEMMAYLHRSSYDAPIEPFTAEEIAMILSRHGMPKDLSQYQNPGLVPLFKKLHAEQLVRAQENFREPSRMHSLGELLESTLVLKGLFISQLAQQSGISVEDIEAYIEKRSPSQPLQETQLVRMAEISGLALEDIRRITAETAQSEEVKQVATQPMRPYGFDPNRFATGMIRDAEE